jgi:hypothetical protein
MRDFYGSGSITRVDHTQPSITFPGERHTYLYTDSGIKKAAFCGPGTRVVERLKAKTKPISEVDKTCMAHDMRYSLAKNTKDTRKADNEMIKKIKKIKNQKKDYKINTLAGTAIKAKVILEDKGVISKTKYIDFKKNPKEGSEEHNIIRDNLADLEQQGYGKKPKKPNPPAYDLKIKLMKKFKK